MSTKAAWIWAAVLLGGSWAAAGLASAQQMGQGEARISARSDVRLGIESGPGTHGPRLQAMVDAVTAKLGTVRACYADVTEDRPTVQGAMRLRAVLTRTARRLDLRVENDTTRDTPLSRCVLRAIESANYEAVSRPAQVIISLDFTNTAARGVEQMQERAGREADVNVTADADGNMTASGGTPEVRFRVIGSPSSSAQVAAVQRSMRASIAGLLDCRRRAGRREMNPAGDIRVRLSVTRQGRVTAREGTSTVQDERAPTCVTRALGRARFEAAAAGRSEIVLTFAPRQYIAEAIE